MSIIKKKVVESLLVCPNGDAVVNEKLSILEDGKEIAVIRESYAVGDDISKEDPFVKKILQLARDSGV